MAEALVFEFFGKDRGAGREFDKLSGKADNLGDKVDGSTKRASKFGTAFKAAGRVAGLGVLAAGAGIAIGAGKAIKAFADFDQSMAHVKAATHETAGNMNLLRQAALDAGKDTVYSATEAAGAIEELSKAGVATKDVLGGGLKGALSLASAGSLEVGEAAEIAATALVQFNLSGKQVPHVADLLAAGAGKAQGSVHDLGYALKMGGLVASQFGISVEDTIGTMAAFAAAGLTGSDAGTSFKTMLLKLANPSDKAKAAMDRLGISAYDAKGKFVGLPGLADQLQKKLKDLTPKQRDAALAMIFGSDALRGANVLYKQGRKGIEEWIKKVNDQGYAAETAATKLDNLKGDVEKLQGSLETMFIQAGGAGNTFARKVVQGLTTVLDKVNDSIPKAQKAFGEFRDGLLGKNRSTKDEKGRIRIEPFIPKTKLEKLGHDVRSAVTNLDFSGLMNTITDGFNFSGAVKSINKGLAKADWGAAGKTLGTGLVNALTITQEGADKIGGKFARAAADVNWGKFGDELSEFVGGFLVALVKAWGDAQVDMMKDVAGKLWEGWKDGWGNGFSDFMAGMPGWLRLIIAGVKKVFGIKSPSTVFYDIGSDVVQGFVNGWKAKFGGAIGQAERLGRGIRSRFANGKSWLVQRGKDVVNGLTSGMNSRRSALLKTVSNLASGVVSRFAKVKNTRGSAAYVVNSVMGRLITKFNAVSKALGGKGIGVPKFRYGGYTGAMSPETGGGSNLDQLASGGMIRGRGTGTSDSILARLSNREFVVNAKQTARNRDLLEAINKGAPGFASGGLVAGDMTTRAYTDPKGYLKGLQRPVLSSFLPRLGGSAWGSMLKQIPRKIAALSLSKIEKIFKTLGYGAGMVGRVVAFAKSQSGKPYQWGGVGNPSWDCSGFMSGLTNLFQGRNPRSRLFTTASFGGGRGVAGFQRGAKSVFQVGVNPGRHMAGTIYVGNRGFNVESGGSGGVRFGGGAQGASYGAYRFGLRKFGVAHKGRAGLEGSLMARGGYGRAGDMALAGENGAELIKFRNPASVYNGRETTRALSKSMGDGGGNTTIHATIVLDPTKMDPNAAAKYMEKAFAELKKHRGGGRLQFEAP